MIALLFFLLFGSDPLCAEPVVAYPEKARAGEFISLLIYSNREISEIRMSVKSDSGRTAVFQSGFQISDGPNREMWAVILAVPKDIESGVYYLEGYGRDTRGTVRTKHSISIESREYLYEEIPLNSAMTDLRTSDDPRKIRESAELWKLLTTFNALSIYHSGKFIDPLDQSVTTSYFGDRRLYRYADGGTEKSTHLGIDLAAPEGTPVLACGRGRIAFAGERIITGNTIVIEHLPGVYSLYYHLDEMTVAENDLVDAGRQIGKVGATGLVTGAHLHWEIRIGGIPVDPESTKEADLLDKDLIIGKISVY